MRNILLALCLSLLSGCGMGYVVKTYGDTKVEEVDVNESTFRIFHRPDLHKVMVTPSIGKAFVSGLTFQTYDPSRRKGMDLAVEKYLQDKGLKGCTATRDSEVMNEQWEFSYRCQAP